MGEKKTFTHFFKAIYRGPYPRIKTWGKRIKNHYDWMIIPVDGSVVNSHPFQVAELNGGWSDHHWTIHWEPIFQDIKPPLWHCLRLQSSFVVLELHWIWWVPLWITVALYAARISVMVGKGERDPWWWGKVGKVWEKLFRFFFVWMAGDWTASR